MIEVDETIKTAKRNSTDIASSLSWGETKDVEKLKNQPNATKATWE